MPAEPELSVVLEQAEACRTVLDLGAGAGRIADALAVAGYDVLAVDESADMLSRVEHARTFHSRIEDLALGERFDLVLLLSHLVNSVPDAYRDALLRSAARHVSASGTVLIQRLEPGRGFRPGTSRLGDVEVSLLEVNDMDWPTVQATTRYRLHGNSWNQPWTLRVLDDEQTVRVLRAAGLAPLAMANCWVTAQLA